MISWLTRSIKACWECNVECRERSSWATHWSYSSARAERRTEVVLAMEIRVTEWSISFIDQNFSNTGRITSWLAGRGRRGVQGERLEQWKNAFWWFFVSPEIQLFVWMWLDVIKELRRWGIWDIYVQFILMSYVKRILHLVRFSGLTRIWPNLSGGMRLKTTKFF
jgi:hypothetical protein